MYIIWVYLPTEMERYCSFIIFFSAKGGYIDRLWWLCTDFGLNRYSGFWYDESSFVEVDMSKCVNTFIREYITHHALVSFSVVAG